jgi:hypothetical protein
MLKMKCQTGGKTIGKAPEISNKQAGNSTLHFGFQ